MKRVIATICIFAMLLSTTVFATETKPTLTIDSVTATQGGSISVPIRISGNTGIAGATISITYDKALSVTGISKGAAFTSLTMTPPGNFSANPIKIIWDGTDADTSNGIIATMTFQTPSTPGQFKISATGDIVDGVPAPVAVTIQNGSIIVPGTVDNVVALSGAVTTPIKDGTDMSTLSGNNVSAAVTWEPMLVANKFAKGTVYTATITVSPADGYNFGTNAGVTLDGYVFTKNNAGKYIATKTFEKTPDKDQPTAIAPTGLIATYGDTLSNVALSNPAGNTAGSWAWKEPLTTKVGNAGSQMHTAIFTPTSIADYVVVEKPVTIAVAKKKVAAPVISANAKVYDGTMQEVTYDAAPNSAYVTVAGTSSAMNAGKYAVTASLKDKDNTEWSGKGNSTDITLNWTIQAKPLAESEYTIVVTPTDYDYTGAAITPAGVTVKVGNTTIANSEYRLSYSDNINAGVNAKVVVSDVTGGNYILAEKTQLFAINQVAGALSFNPPASILYDGAPIDCAKTDSSTHDITYNYTGDGVITVRWYDESGNSIAPAPINAGNYQVGISAAAGTNYQAVAEVKQTFTISGKAVEQDIKNAITGYIGTYDKKAHIAVSATASVGSYTLTYSTDGATFNSNIPSVTNVSDSKTIQVKISKLNYQEEVIDVTATVNPAAVTSVTLADGTLTYTGKEQTKDVSSVTSGELVLTAGDYTITGNKQTTAGTNHVVTVAGTGNYTGSATATFGIDKSGIDINNLNWNYSSAFNYTGSECSVELSSIPDTIDVSYGGGAKGIFVGTYTATATATPKDTTNYSITGTIPNQSWQIGAVADPAIITATASVTKGGNTVNLSHNVSNALGAVSYAITGEGKGCSVDASTGVFTAGNTIGAVTVTVTVAAKDMGGDATNEYLGKSGTISIAISEKDSKQLAVTQSNCTYGETLAAPGYATAPAAGVATITYAGTLRKDGSAYASSTKPTDAGTYTVTVTYETPSEIWRGTSTPFIIEPKIISDASVILGAALSYTGEEQVQIVSQVRLDSMNIIDACNASQNTGNHAGQYTLIVTAKDASNYTGSVNKTFSIAKKSITPTVAVTGTYIFTGNAITPTYTVNDGETALAVTDYSAALTSNTNVGNGKITITEETSGNYTFVPTEQTFSVGKAAAQPLPDITVSQKFSITNKQNKAIGNGGMPANAGTLTYGKGVESNTGTVTVSSWSVNATSGEVQYTITGGAVGATVTLPVIIGSSNYADSIANVKLILTDRDVPTVSADNITATYDGVPVSASKIVGTANLGNITVTGTWSWKDATNITNVVDSGTKAVIFTPTDGSNYTVVEDSIILTINKATPTGTPTIDKITTNGKMLADTNLAIGSIAPAGGTIAWNMGNTQLISANTAYYWTYTPTDTANYNALIGSITPYSVYIGGGSTDTPAVTVPVTGGAQIEANATISGTIATVKIDAAKLEKVINGDIKSGEIAINLVALGKKNIDTVHISAAVIKVIADAANDPNSDVNDLLLILDSGSVSYDAAALKVIASAAITNTVSLNIKPVAQSSLGAAQKETFRNEPAGAKLFDLKLMVGGKEISDFGGGHAMVTCAFICPANWNAKGITVERLNMDGSKSRMQSSYLNGYIKWITDSHSTYLVSYNEDATIVNPFTDVKESDYYYDAILWAVGKGVTSGKTATTFAPNATCTRAQAVTLLWRAMGSPEPTTSKIPFSDVAQDAYYYKAVMWAVEKDITSGTSRTAFSPNKTVDRSQTVTLLWRAAGSPVATGAGVFQDTPSNAYYANAVLWAVEKGITEGTGKATFAPLTLCNRGQLVTFLYRHFGK